MDVKGLKLADGPAHDLRQFYFLLDPTGYPGDGFYEPVARVADAVADRQTPIAGAGLLCRKVR